MAAALVFRGGVVMAGPRLGFIAPKIACIQAPMLWLPRRTSVYSAAVQAGKNTFEVMVGGVDSSGPRLYVVSQGRAKEYMVAGSTMNMVALDSKYRSDLTEAEALEIVSVLTHHYVFVIK